MATDVESVKVFSYDTIFFRLVRVSFHFFPYYFEGIFAIILQVINHPVPKPASIESTDDVQTSNALAFAIAINITFGMSFLVATFSLFAIRVCKSFIILPIGCMNV